MIKIQFKSLRFDEIRLYMIARVKNAQKNQIYFVNLDESVSSM